MPSLFSDTDGFGELREFMWVALYMYIA